MKSKLFSLKTAILMSFFSSSAFAQQVGGNAGEQIGALRILSSLKAQLEGIGAFVFVVAFLVGLFFAYLFYQCLTKMSDEQARKQENLVPKMITYFLAAGGFMFIGVMPVILGESVFGIEGGPEVGTEVDTEKFGFKD